MATNSAASASRRDFLTLLAAGVAGCASGLQPSEPLTSRPPNIVLVLVDDLGWADLSCYGSRYHETPHVDRLAAQGMRFTNAYAACAVCSPTRAAIMTGRYPARLGITDWIRSRFQKGITKAPDESRIEYVDEGKQLLCPPTRSALPLSEITIAELLRDAGYATGHIGKWHLGADAFYPEKQGFDRNVGGCDFGQPPSYFDPYENKSQGPIHNLPPRQPGEYLTDREADEALSFIRDNRDTPFFLNLCHYAVHTPLMAKPDLLNKYKTKPPTEQKNPAYATMVESVDQAIGKIMTLLQQLNLAENTIVIFTSDNGGLIGPTSNAPLRSGKGYPYEGGIRVPLIVRWPGVVRGNSLCDQIVTSVDFLPTLCEAARTNPPADRPIDGLSLMPALRQQRPLQRDAVYWHFPHYRGDDVVPYSIIRAGHWKLIRRYQDKEFELFNLNDDPREANDLASRLPQKTRELHQQLDRWLADCNAMLPRKKTG